MSTVRICAMMLIGYTIIMFDPYVSLNIEYRYTDGYKMEIML